MSGLILEDCPFCGNHKAVCKESSVFSWVACLICSAQGPACLTRPEARRAWNVASRKRKEWIEPPIYNEQGLRIKCYDCGSPMAVHPVDKSWSCTGSCG